LNDVGRWFEKYFGGWKPDVENGGSGFSTGVKTVDGETIDKCQKMEIMFFLT